MSEPRSELIDAYRDGCRVLRRAVSGMTPEQLQARPVPGRWSTLEVVCHLADSEQAWCHRLKRIIGEHLPLLISYDESRLVDALGYQGRELAPELALFEANRLQMAAILERLPDSAWSRAGVHNERGLVTLEEGVRIETEHVIDHLRHVAEKRLALGLPAAAPG